MKIALQALILLLLLSACNSKEELQPALEEIDIQTPQEDLLMEERVTHENESDNTTERTADEEEEQLPVNEQKPLYQLNQANFRIEPIMPEANERVVLLTIDDAPDKYGAEMAEILSSLNVKAIFFVNGHFLLSEEGKQQLKRIHELGHEIGNHTMNHPDLSTLSEEEQRKEILELNDLIEDIIGIRPRFFRAPFGINTDTSKEVIREEGMQWMNWSYGYDFQKEYRDAELLADIMVNTNLLSNGANVLMHDREFTKDALADIVRGMQEKGYEMVNPHLIK